MKYASEMRPMKIKPLAMADFQWIEQNIKYICTAKETGWQSVYTEHTSRYSREVLILFFLSFHPRTTTYERCQLKPHDKTFPLLIKSMKSALIISCILPATWTYDSEELNHFRHMNRTIYIKIDNLKVEEMVKEAGMNRNRYAVQNVNFPVIYNTKNISAMRPHTHLAIWRERGRWRKKKAKRIAGKWIQIHRKK